ncbi:putative glycosyltransferase EpsD [Flavobacterium suaedae]|uniref:Glycosyltransferase EpsD n=1 Tax=Flavobacterium suaedae TaxID=1767027 RepID=A0ABQ1JLJ0_9FLAO|nr:glycosyltransferase family 4 protein [Flavobacterium suaedae]GGB72098.1 putative glycosyltransferase EpsD [Flavobacterium suaedae]
MKKKVLFTASIAKHLLRFHLPYLQWFQEQGYETHVACEGDENVPYVDKQWNVPFIRSPFSVGHIKAYKILKGIIDSEQYAMVHCHTPMASIVTRLAAKDARKKGTKVLYTAHGFHFYNGASLINWLTYYPVEVLASAQADAVVTINSEDYNRIKEKGSKKTEYFLIPGIGVAKSKFFPVKHDEKIKLRESKGFKSEDIIAVYAAEFIHRKNHQFLIEAILKHKEEFPNLKLLFCGRGVLKDKMEALVREKKLESVVLFMGFRNDIDEIFKMADIGISSSKQEGLGLNLVEEMMCELPILATVDRGHKEIIRHDVNGYLFAQQSESEFIKYLKELYNNEQLRKDFGKESIAIAENFEIINSLAVMSSIYKKFL